MRSVSVLILLLSPLSALAADISWPIPGSAACFRREYTADHLERNPRQTLRSLYVLLSVPAQQGENEGESLANAKVLGRTRPGEMFANQDPGCTLRADGSYFCAVECDGGSFSLERERGRESILMRVTKDYYFPLYRNGADPERMQPQDTLELNGADADNNVFRLFPASLEECDGKLEEIQQQSYGC